MKSYSEDFKLKALKLLQENGGNVDKTVRELRISKNTLKQWLRPDVKLDFATVVFARLSKEMEKVFKETIKQLIKKIPEANAKDLIQISATCVKLITELTNLAATPLLKSAITIEADKEELLDQLKDALRKRRGASKEETREEEPEV